jgi:large subunit ribosomal protein L5
MSAATRKTTTKKTRKNKKSKTKKQDNPHRTPRISKITVNIGVGEAGERLEKAASVIQSITGHKPVQTLSRTTNKDWAIRKRMPIGCKVTLRGEAGKTFLIEALKTREQKIAEYSFDDEGNCSFGIPDHTLFASQKYDPSIGIFGMDICVTMEKPGYRIKHRRIGPRGIPARHKVKREETMAYISESFHVEVV